MPCCHEVRPADYVRLPQEGYSTGPARRRSSSVRLLAEWRALIANMTVPELRVPPALTSAHHHIHLDRRAQRQGGHADRGAGRVGLGEVPAVRLVHRAELRHVGQVDPDPDHVVQVLADRRQGRRDVAQDLVGLLGDVAADQLAGGRVLGHLPGQEKQSAAAHGHRERQARCWQLVTGNGVTWHGRGVPFPYVLSRWVFVGGLPQGIWRHGALPGWIFVNRYRAGVPEWGSAHNGTAIGDSGPGVAGLPPVAAAAPAACVPPAAADGPGILLRLWYSMAHCPARTAAAHYRCSKAGHRAGSDRGSPNHGSTLASKRVMAQIRSPARVRT